MIEWKFTINLNPLPLVELTNTTMCNFDSTDSFLLNLLNTNFHICNFEISLKGFRSPSVVDLYEAICFHQFLIVNLVSVDACRVRKLQKPHKSHRSNSQVFQELLIRVFILYLVVLDWNPKRYLGLRPNLKSAKHDFQSVKPIFRSIELHSSLFLLSTAWQLLKIDLNNLEQCLTSNLDMFLFPVC